MDVSARFGKCQRKDARGDDVTGIIVKKGADSPTPDARIGPSAAASRLNTPRSPEPSVAQTDLAPPPAPEPPVAATDVVPRRPTGPIEAQADLAPLPAIALGQGLWGGGAIGRRSFLAGAALALLAPRPVAAESVDQDLLEAARALATAPYDGRRRPLPAPFDTLTYDSYRGIRTVPGVSGGLPLGPDYAVDLLPPGFYFQDTVDIDLETAAGIAKVPFSTDLFDFDSRYFDAVPPGSATGAGFSGLRIRHPINAPGRMDEVLVMQGASYFRAIGQDMVYGLSARALALGTGGAAPEEFPRIVRLRVHPPATAGAWLSAVIDSPSLTAYLRLDLLPGVETVTQISVTVFPRRTLADIGIAPLTSMYFKGPLRAVVADDFRPAVHDSDALWIQNGRGETLWRPLSNPATLQTSSFSDTGPAGYGLYQTPRGFLDFQDGEAAYHRRPSARVVPRGDWGPGAVMLVEIPTADEFFDNQVAFWRPAAPLIQGQAYRFDYDIVWTLAPPPLAGLAPVLQSRSGLVHDGPGLRYVVDFDTRRTDLVPDLRVDGMGAEAVGLAAFPLAETGWLRVTFVLLVEAAEVAELRLTLTDPMGAPASPVWLHRWTPARGGGR